MRLVRIVRIMRIVPIVPAVWFALLRVTVSMALTMSVTGIACRAKTSSSNDQTPRILTFSVSPEKIDLGEEATLTWEIANSPLGAEITPDVGLLAAKGSIKVQPLFTTRYALKVPGDRSDNPVRAEQTITVVGPPRVLKLDARPLQIAEGESTTLSWHTYEADDVFIEPDIGTRSPTGELFVTPETTTTYSVVARRGDQKSTPRQVEVRVVGGDGPVISEFEANPADITEGQSFTLSWRVARADSVAVDNGIGPQGPTGSISLKPSQTTTYTITANRGERQTSASVTVNVSSAASPRVLRLDATPSTVGPGSNVEVSWETDHAEGVYLEADRGAGGSREPLGSFNAKGSYVDRPLRTTTYKLTAFTAAKTATATKTVTVAEIDEPVILSFTSQPALIFTGGTATLEWQTQNVKNVELAPGLGEHPANGTLQVTPTQTTTYTLTAVGATENKTMQTVVTVQPPPPQITTFEAQPTSIVPGGSSTLRWNTTDATGVVLDQGLGAQPTMGSLTVSPAQTTVYTLTSNGPSGSASAQVSVTVTTPESPVVDRFSASPQQITPGSTAQLSWETTNATRVSLDHGIGNVALDGTTVVSPTADTTYTLTAEGPGGTTAARTTISVVSIVGDTCAEAFVITGSGTYHGDTRTAQNNYQESAACTGHVSAGPDVAYRVSLEARDRLRARLSPTSPAWDAALYLVRNCTDIAASCVAGEDNGNPEEIDFTALAPAELFLIVDGFGGATGAYSLEVTITREPIANDRCEAAIDVTAGGTFSGSTRAAVSDYSPSAGAASCTGYPANGPDVTYSARLQAGERLRASLSAAWDSSLYLVTNCASAASTCLTGQDNGDPEQIDFVAPQTATYFLIVDSFANTPGDFTLDVSISPPATGGDRCEAPIAVPRAGGTFSGDTQSQQHDYGVSLSCVDAAPGKDAVYAISPGAGEVSEIVAEFAPGVDGALYVLDRCGDAAATTCVAGVNASPGGEDEVMRFVARTSATQFLVVDSRNPNEAGPYDLTIATYGGRTCADAIPLLRGTEWFTTIGAQDDYSPTSAACTGYAASGPDRAYRINLAAGEQLVAEVEASSSSYDTSVYVVSDCGDVSGSCLFGSDASPGQTEVVAPVAPRSGPYYLVIDGYGGGAGEGTVTASVRRGDSCQDAYVVPASGGRFQGTTAGYGADVGTNDSATSCTNFTQTGRDAIYRIDLPAGARVAAALQTSWDSALYLVSDCANAASTCLVGSDAGSPESITFTNTSASTRTLFLVVDAWRESIPGSGSIREGLYDLIISIE